MNFNEFTKEHQTDVMSVCTAIDKALADSGSSLGMENSWLRSWSGGGEQGVYLRVNDSSHFISKADEKTIESVFPFTTPNGIVLEFNSHSEWDCEPGERTWAHSINLTPMLNGEKMIQPGILI